MKKLLSTIAILAALLIGSPARAQQLGVSTVKGSATLLGGGGGGGGSAPTFILPAATFTFSTPVAITLGTVSTGDIIDYFVTTTLNSQTFTVTDNCNTGGTSDTNVTDAGPTNSGTTAATSQAGHLVIGLGRTSCQISVTFTGGGDGILSAGVVHGSSGVDVVSTITTIAGTGTGANAISSAAVTTGHTDMCVAATIDVNLGGGTLTHGTTLAWTVGGISATFPSGNESFAQSGAGSITATFGITVNAFTQTKITCYKP